MSCFSLNVLHLVNAEYMNAVKMVGVVLCNHINCYTEWSVSCVPFYLCGCHLEQVILSLFGSVSHLLIRFLQNTKAISTPHTVAFGSAHIPQIHFEQQE